MKKFFTSQIIFFILLFFVNKIEAASIIIKGDNLVQLGKEMQFEAFPDGVIINNNSTYSWILDGGVIVKMEDSRNRKVTIRVDNYGTGKLTLKCHLSKTGVLGLSNQDASIDIYLFYPISFIGSIQTDYTTSHACKENIYKGFSFWVFPFPNTANYKWTLPAGWNSTNLTTSKITATCSDVSSFTGTVILNVEQELKTYPVTKKFDQLTYTFQNGTPVSIGTSNTSLIVCPKGSVTINPIIQGGSGNYTYEWKLNTNTNSTVISTQKNYTDVSTSNLNYNRVYNFTVTNNNCKASQEFNVLCPGEYTWLNDIPRSNNGHVPALMVNNKVVSSLAIRRGGSVYYIGNDNNIHGYDWNSTLNSWTNVHVFTSAQPNGLCLFPESSNLLYFIANSNNELLYVDVVGTNSMPSTTGINNVIDIKKDWLGGLYVATPNDIYYVDMNGFKTLIKTTTNTIRKIAFGQIIGRVFINFTDGSVDSFSKDSPFITVTNITSNIVHPDSDFDTDWNGNLYFISSSNKMISYTTNSSALTQLNSNSFRTKFFVNKSSGNLYVQLLGSTEIQIRLLDRSTMPYTLKSLAPFNYFPALEANFVFTHPNLHYFTQNGYVAMCYYLTSAPCPPAATKDLADMDVSNNVDYSLANTTSNIQLTLSPNPAIEYSRVHFNLVSSDDVTIEILDMQGQVIERKNGGNFSAGEQEIELNVSSMNKGMYLVRLLNGEDTQIGQQKLIVQ